MIHHIFRGAHHTIRHTHRLFTGNALLKGGYHAGRLTAQHGPTIVKAAGHVAARGGVHIGKMAWTHGPTVAKHTARFMVKSALKGFKLLSS